MSLRNDADFIIEESIKKVLPDEAVARALQGKEFGKGKIYVVAIGKAAWQMATTASEVLGNRISLGVVCTKYEHAKGVIPSMICYEAGHPIPDKNSFIATQAVLDMVSDLKKEDTVLFLVSGGGSALFEKPLVDEEELSSITKEMLDKGADISEMNTIRKRLSAVKGGKFAKLCSPAHVYSIVLSDIIGDPLDMIASGPAYPDSSTADDAFRIVKKYQLKLSERAMGLLEEELPKELENVETVITGSVSKLCNAAKEACEKLGYQTIILTDQLDCQAKEAGSFLSSIARTYQNSSESVAFIAGGETIVCVTGKGKGGRNQELALAAAVGITGLENVAIFSVGSDGTDGPTDAAGAYVDGYTKGVLEEKSIDIFKVLQENDAYHALEKVNGLIVTGPTGTNVNDVAVVLIKKE